VAVTILMFGLLTIVGVSSSTARSLGESRSDGLAAQYAQSRFEWLASLECVFNANLIATGLNGITTGEVTEVTHRGITERYKVVMSPGAIGNNVIILYDTVSWQTRRTTRRQGFTSLIPCRPGS
jgi:hypothetical protein